MEIKRKTGNCIAGDLLADARGIVDGEWVSIQDLSKISVQFDMQVGNKVKIFVSDSFNKPSDDQVQLGNEHTTSGIVTIEGYYRWIKAKVTNYVSGTITVNFAGYHIQK